MKKSARIAAAVGMLLVSSGGCSVERTDQLTGALSQSSAAQMILDGLRQQFTHKFELPPVIETQLAGDDTPVQKTEPVFRSGEATAISAMGNALAPTFAKTPAVAMTVPTHADGAIELKAASMTARVAVNGASTSTGELASGYLVYANATAKGHLVLRPSLDGIEDYVTFSSAPTTPAVDYTLTLVSGVAGLRVVSNTLELLDSSGAPRLRMRAPFIIGSDGVAVAASMSVSGCKFDNSPIAPWGRTPTAPGAGACSIRVSWNGSGVTYPAVLDPSWSSTGSLSQARADHTVTLLNDGHALAACGINSAPSQPGAELYDATTGTWATTGAPNQTRTDQLPLRLCHRRQPDPLPAIEATSNVRRPGGVRALLRFEPLQQSRRDELHVRLL